MWKSLGLFCAILNLVFTASIPNGLIPVFRPRIVGGKPIDIEEVPYMVAVVYYGAQYCGGSIISENVVLTAAHCTPGITERRSKIRMGTAYRTKGGLLLPVQKIMPHEEYKDYLDGKDIALIWMKSPIVFSANIQTIKLPVVDQNLEEGTMARVTGWGYISPGGPTSDQLRVIDVPIVDRQICFEAFRAWVNTEMICAGYNTGGIDACQMDSGGPLVVENTVVGIVSWGNGCATPDYYGVYTNVAHFKDWIYDKLNNSTWIYEN